LTEHGARTAADLEPGAGSIAVSRDRIVEALDRLFFGI
jgi:hypothetical protein